MLYKVTPFMAPPKLEKKAEKTEKTPRKKRSTSIYDHEGHEVLITLMCLKCKGMKPLAQFGLRKMADGAIRNQPWCRTCRASSTTKKENGISVAPLVEEGAHNPVLAVNSSQPTDDANSSPSSMVQSG